MSLRTPICDLFGIEHPIFLAGMGGVAYAELAAAVSEAGGYGVLGMAAMPPEGIRAQMREVRRRTAKPFGVDLLAALPQQVEAAIDVILEEGASAFVAKDSPSDDVIAAARHASVSPRSFAAADLAGAMQRKLAPSGPQLSARELEVLKLLAEGLGVAAIARQLYVSESTAKTHISKIYDKLGAANRAQAIMLAIRSGLLGGDDQH